jgi:deoxyadenosine/deoxycytidine kinase
MRVRRIEEPRYVAVDGPPGSGASAVARGLAAATGATLYSDPAPGNPFRDDFARAPERFAFQTQTYCLLTRYRQQVELAQPDLFSPGGAVADYLFARDELFARVTLRPEELHLYQRIHQLLDARIPRPDLVVYVTAARDSLRARLRALGHSSDRVIKLSYRLVGLISFLTAGPDEVRAWPVPDGSSAVDAAGAIHTDLARGFIRAETIAYEELLAAGSLAEAKRHGKVRSEGKTYRVQDGDVVEILFSR